MESIAPTMDDEPSVTAYPTSIDTSVSGQELGLSLLLYCSLGLVICTCFCTVRKMRPAKFAPRQHFVSQPEVVPDEVGGWLRWISLLTHRSKADALILKHVGLDAYTSIRLMKLAFELFALLTLMAVPILLPLYGLSGERVNLGIQEASGIEKFTMQYMTGPCCSEALLWVPCFAVFAFTLTGIVMLHKEYHHLVPLQREFYLYRDRTSYTILIERIPAEIFSKRALQSYFNTVFPDSVLNVDLVPRSDTVKDLVDKMEERKSIVMALEKAKLLEYKRRKQDSEGVNNPEKAAHSTAVKREKTFKFPKGKEWMKSRACCEGSLCNKLGFGKLVDAVPYYEARLKDVDREVNILKQEAKRALYNVKDEHFNVVSNRNLNTSHRDLAGYSDGAPVEEDGLWQDSDWLLGDHKWSGNKEDGVAAFVTFKSKLASTAASQCMYSEAPVMIINSAPEPSDVNWTRLACHPGVVLFARIVVVLFSLVLLLLYGVLTSTISASTNLPALREKWEELDVFLADNSWAVSVFQQIAPLLLVVAFSLVPVVLNLILELRYELSESARETAFFRSYYTFLVVQVFLFYQISGAVLNIVAVSWDNPREFVNVMAQTIPRNATFFMQYIVIRTFGSLPVELLRVGAAVTGYIIRPILCGIARTPRELRDDKCGCRSYVFAGDVWFGRVNANFLFMFTIGVVYSVMAPLLLIFATMYFGVSLLVYRHQFLYVYVKRYEGGGRNWASLMFVYIFAFMLLQFTMLGVFALSGAFSQSVMMFPLLLGTIGYAYFMHEEYSNHFYVSLSDARKFDIQHRSKKVKHKPLDYTHSTLRVSEQDEPMSPEEMVRNLRLLRESRKVGKGVMESADRHQNQNEQDSQTIEVCDEENKDVNSSDGGSTIVDIASEPRQTQDVAIQ